MNNELLELSNLPSDDKTGLLAQLLQLSHLIIDSKGIVHHISDALSQLIGASANNIIGNYYASLLAPEPSACFAAGNIKKTNTSTFKEILLLVDGSQQAVYFTLGDITISSETFKVITHFCVKDSDDLPNNSQLFEQPEIAEFLLRPGQLSIIAANQEAQILCGFSEPVLKQMLLSDLCELSQRQLLCELEKLHTDSDKYFNLDLIVASGEPCFVQLKVNSTQRSGVTLRRLQVINISAQKEQLEKLQQAEDLSDSLFASLPGAALLMDSFGVVDKINNEMLDILGKNSNELVGMRARSVLPQQLKALISPVETSANKESLLINNQLVDVNFNQQPIRDSKNKSLGLLLTIEQVKTAPLPLRLKALEVANEMAVYAIFVTDKLGEIIYVSEGFEYQLGYKASALIGQHISMLNDPANDLSIDNNMLDVINQKRIWRGTRKNLKYSGSSYWADVTIKPMLDDQANIEYFVGISVDVTQQRELHEAGIYSANYDFATGLANKVLAKDRLNGMLARAQRRKLTVAVVYLDISKFELVTQEFDLDKSNKVLSTYCHKMQSTLRCEDALVRMSKSRLAILLPDLPDVTALEVVVAKIDKVNRQPIVISDDTFELDIRQGASYYPEQGRDVDSLFLNAESSLQRAWHSNERIGSFCEQQNAQTIMHFNLCRDIVAALRNQELEVLYQPIFDLMTNSVASTEARLQWRHQHYGIICGDELYAVAEASGIMADLGLWLFERACVDLVYWHQQGYHHLTLSMAISHGQLRDRNIAQAIMKILDRYNLAANFICLELPLSYIATQWLEFDIILQELALLGISLQYDRFGERGAYISDLHHFPFSGLKLSSEYVAKLSDDPNAANLVQGIISLAQALDMKVTAVNVSQFSQILQLQEMGCHYVQGDFNCNYLPRNEIDAFLVQHVSYKKLNLE